MQFYSSEVDKKSEKTIKTTTQKEDETEKLIKEMLEEAMHPNIVRESLQAHSGYSTSYCWPSVNDATLGLVRHQPAQSCEHILNANATASDGFYWIDPNLGCSSDAISVYCKFTSNETCVHHNSTLV